MLAAPLQQFIIAGLRSRLELDEGAGGLAPFVVRFRYDRHGHDCRMLVKRILDFNG